MKLATERTGRPHEFTCVHGTQHTGQEGIAAINWAATNHDADELKNGDCWIARYRQRNEEESES